MTKQQFAITLAASLFATLLIQNNVTSAILFNGYLKNPSLIEGNSYYLIMINESAKGNWQNGNPFNKEWSRAPYLYPPLNIHIPGLVKKIFHLDIKTRLVLTLAL